MADFECEVLRFIDALLKGDYGENNGDVRDLFLHKCDYWFSVVLHREFLREGAQIMFSRDEFHFCTLIQGCYYDASGRISGDGYERWEDLPEFGTDSDIRRLKIRLL